MAMTKQNSNALMIVLFLYRLIAVFKEYFKELEEVRPGRDDRFAPAHISRRSPFAAHRRASGTTLLSFTSCSTR